MRAVFIGFLVMCELKYVNFHHVTSYSYQVCWRMADQLFYVENSQPKGSSAFLLTVHERHIPKAITFAGLIQTHF